MAAAHGLDVREGVSADAVDTALCRERYDSASETHGFNLTVSGSGAVIGRDSTSGSVFARHVVWAGGQQSFPWMPTNADVPGASLGMHSSSVPSWAALVGRTWTYLSLCWQ